MRKFLFLILLAVAGPAAAQAPVVTAEPETVHSDAQRENKASIAGETVQAVLDPVYGADGQYARWKTPLCLNVYGLKPAAKILVERRIKQIAAQVGAPVERRDPCTPNATIAFTTDTKATLASIHKARDWLLPDYDFIRMRLKQSLPVQAWYGVAIQGADGRRQLVGALDEGVPETPVVTVSAAESNLLSTGISTSIATVMIVVDTNTVRGRPLGTLADYFALLALSQTRDTAHCKTVPSIANLLFTDCDAPLRADAITETDLAMLTALYQTSDASLQKLQRQRIIGAMRRTLQAGPAAPSP